MQSIKHVLPLIIVFGVSACNTTIYPEGDNTYSSVTTSSTQYSAESNALKDAENYCKKRGQQLTVTTHRTNYYGPDSDNKMLGAIIGGIMDKPNPTVSGEDYEVKMRFRCK